ncbi:MAG: 16S rRNA (guanine(966)-N(2))-methyltransferase RsmD [Gammaproteobacteria bacterium]|nr:MAG: 16S rRNA (guanine(966)-N(2))-methyltransferase RsmD [Gammaproteobacteria bacterium]
MNNQFRIIGGEWRSRKLTFPDAEGLRPTSGRVRETLFNWLQDDLAGARCLDLFAGSGALGLEAASRGAATVIQVENSQPVIRALKANKERLKATRISIIKADTLAFLKKRVGSGFDLVFMDPPFHQNLLLPTCRLLEQNDWLNEGAKIYLEVEKRFELEGEGLLPENWQQLKSKKAGEVCYFLYQSV